MIKVQKIHGFSAELNFNSPQREFECYWQSFLGSELGKVYQSIPWMDLTRYMKFRDSRKGPSRLFGPQGMLALMFLKSYVGCSDRRLIEHLNGNIDFQLFCGIFLGTNRISNYKMISDIRCQVSEKLKIQEHQKILSVYWKPYMRQSNIMLTDATCYETSMRYPTNVKLL